MNEQDNQEADNPQSIIENPAGTESLADLPLTGAQAAATKGGTIGVYSAAGQRLAYNDDVNTSAAINPFGNFSGGIHVAAS